MTYANQHAYDNASAPELSDYRDEPAFAEFAEYVTLELLNGRDWQNLISDILMIDLECQGGGYLMAIEWVCKRLTEKHFRGWISDY